MTSKIKRGIFFFNDTAPTEIYTLSLHDALPICAGIEKARAAVHCPPADLRGDAGQGQDRKSTRLNSSHLGNSYAVFCLQKKRRHRLRRQLRDRGVEPHHLLLLAAQP